MGLTVASIAVPVIMLVLAGIYWSTIRAGRNRERLDNAERANDAGRVRTAVEDEVRRLDPTAVDGELRQKWKRG